MKVSIIGLGWLGIPLSKYLQNNGYTVIGSTTSAAKQIQLSQQGINSVLFSLDPHPLGIGFQKLFDSEVQVILIPPRSKQHSGEFYLEQLKYLRAIMENSSAEKVIFISSTGIYSKNSKEGFYSEGDLTAETSGNAALFKAESTFQNNDRFESTIIRFGGLMGSDRIPLKYFSGKEQVDGGSQVNYIHQLDAIRMIEWIISEKLWGHVFNGVAPIHPEKREILESNSRILGIAPPKSYETKESKDQRLIGSEKIMKTGFNFVFPDPIDFSYEKPLSN